MKVSDLQIAKYNSGFSMAHKMSFVDITINSGGRLSTTNIVNETTVLFTSNIVPLKSVLSSKAHARAIVRPQNINGTFISVSTDEQSKNTSYTVNLTSGTAYSNSTTYNVMLPIEYVATGCIKSNQKTNGKWVIDTENKVDPSTLTSSCWYFQWDNLESYLGPMSTWGSGILCNDNKTYHVPTKNDFVSIIPCTLHNATSPTLWDYSGQHTETGIRFGGMTTDHSDVSYWAKVDNVMYAIRFVCTIYCSAWRYEWESAITGGGAIIKVKYLGKSVTTSNANTYLNNVKASGYNWSSEDIITRLFPATGFLPGDKPEGYTTTHSENGRRVRYISTTPSDSDHPNYVWEFLIADIPWAYVGDYNAWHGGSTSSAGRSLRLWLDPNQF